MGELHVVTDEVQQQSGDSISSDESPVPVALVPATPREVTLAGSHLLSAHELDKTTVRVLDFYPLVGIGTLFLDVSFPFFFATY